LQRCVSEHDRTLRTRIVPQQRQAPSLGRVDWGIYVNNRLWVLQEAKSPKVMNAVRTHLPPIGVKFEWGTSTIGSLVLKVFMKVTSFLFISNRLFNKDAGRRIPRSETVRVVLFDLSQSLDRVPSGKG